MSDLAEGFAINCKPSAPANTSESSAAKPYAGMLRG
jgi:hypothetical protein